VRVISTGPIAALAKYCMAYNFLAVERDQLYLLPPSVADWLEEDHLAYFIVDAVEQMDLEVFYRDYREDGRGGWAHEPAMMVAQFYAYCIGLLSSRQIERACHVDVAFRVITANQTPDHTTIARFRARHEGALNPVHCLAQAVCTRRDDLARPTRPRRDQNVGHGLARR
jgi:transposase